MSEEELNNYIANIKTACENRKNGKVSTLRGRNSVSDIIFIHQSLRLAWLAVAEIAKRRGYPCSAQLIKNSIFDEDYEEELGQSGVFKRKIKKNKDFKNCIKGFSTDYVSDSLEFQHKNSKDLYYSLHLADIQRSPKNGKHKYHIHDTWDFELWTKEDGHSLFATTVNDWAWLCENAHILKVIKVDIYFVY